MIRGLYISATGMNAGLKQQDALSNNLANANTAGFKREQTLFQPLLDREIYSYQPSQRPSPIGQLGTGSNFRLGAADFTLGASVPTNRTLDIFIGQPDAYLVVEHNGNRAFTRNGQLNIDNEGYLRTQNGSYLLGTGNQRIRVGSSEEISILGDGQITDLQGSAIGRLQVVRLPNDQSVRRIGDSLWQGPPNPPPAAEPQILQGQLEQANVQVVKEMVNLIAAMRNYETNSKLIQIQDETLGKAVNEVGRR